MGEMTVLINDMKSGDKNDFMLIVEKFQPLIKKYVKLLYKDDKDDSTSELTLAIWEAILKMDYCTNDGQATIYICNAIKNKYYELYRASRKKHDYELNLLEDATVDDVSITETHELVHEDITYGEVRVKEDIHRFLRDFSGLKLEIYKAILLEYRSDYEISMKYQVSRQYVNRMRRQLKKQMLLYYY